jgi:hypothetical protein
MTSQQPYVLHPSEVVLIGHEPIGYDVTMLEGHMVDLVLRVDADLPIGLFVERAALRERHLVEVAALNQPGHAV